jgi:REP element-mobilizing transposase RayT
MDDQNNLSGGTGSTPSGNGAGGAVPVEPIRKHPVHLPVREMSNRSNIVFVTVCSKDRQPFFASSGMHGLFLAAWRAADSWMIGRYVIMPDHVHFFCAPGKRDYPPLTEWMNYWKSLVSRAVQGNGPLAQRVAVERDPPGGTASTPSPIWQRDFWDTQLRRGDSYSEKWEYVRNNPVRAGLVEKAEAWPFSGEMNFLRWTE